MTDETPALIAADRIAMARQIYADYGASQTLAAGDMVNEDWCAAVLAGDADNTHGVKIALAAIAKALGQ